MKYEELYLIAYTNATEARREPGAYIRFYNNQRPHQSLDYRTMAEVFHSARIPRGRIEDRRRSTGTGAGIIGISGGTLA